MNHGLTNHDFSNLSRRVRVGRKRGSHMPNVRPYDRNVKFISLKNSMNLRTVLKGRTPLGG